MRNIWLVALLTAALAWDGPVSAQPRSSKIALVVGVGDYNGNRINDAAADTRVFLPDDPQARADAMAVSGALRSGGYDVHSYTDIDRDSLQRALTEFWERARAPGVDAAVIYFSGAVLVSEGAAYVLPARAQINNFKMARLGAVPLQELVTDVAQASEARVRLVILDGDLVAESGAGLAISDFERLTAERTVQVVARPVNANQSLAPALVPRLSAGLQSPSTVEAMIGALPPGATMLGTIRSAQDRMAFTNQPRLALIIGNADYNVDEDYDDDFRSIAVTRDGFASDLPNTLNDARDLRDALTRIRFTNTVYAENADKATMTAKLLEFRQKVREAGPSALVVVYYAGHAIQVNGANFLVPVGAKLPPLDLTRMSEPDVELALRDYAFPVNDLITSLRNPDGQGANIVILDACRNNPWELRTRAVGGGATRGLADIPVALQRTAIAFATKPGDTALDGEGQRNSPYMTVMKQWIERPGLSIRDLFDGVGNEVVRSTNNRQVPWLNAPPLGSTCLGACAVQ